MSIRSAWPASIITPAGMRPWCRYQESQRHVGLGPDRSLPHARRLGREADDAVGQQQRRQRHPHLALVAVLRRERRAEDLGDPAAGVDLELARGRSGDRRASPPRPGRSRRAPESSGPPGSRTSASRDRRGAEIAGTGSPSPSFPPGAPRGGRSPSRRRAPRGTARAGPAAPGRSPAGSARAGRRGRGSPRGRRTGRGRRTRKARRGRSAARGGTTARTTGTNPGDCGDDGTAGPDAPVLVEDRRQRRSRGHDARARRARLDGGRRDGRDARPPEDAPGRRGSGRSTGRGRLRPQQRVELLEGPGAHRHARGDERRDRVEGRLEALPLPVEADDERLALAEDRADPATARGLRPVLDEDADAVLPGREDGRAQVERPVRLAEDRLRAALGRRHVAPARGVRVEAGGRPRPGGERRASSAGGAARATPPGPRRARERGPRADSRGAGIGPGPAPRRRGRTRPRRRR